jgi:hypothetical protein
MKAIDTVSPIAKAGETDNEEADFILRTWDRFQNKIRLLINCSIKKSKKEAFHGIVFNLCLLLSTNLQHIHLCQP